MPLKNLEKISKIFITKRQKRAVQNQPALILDSTGILRQNDPTQALILDYTGILRPNNPLQTPTTYKPHSAHAFPEQSYEAEAKYSSFAFKFSSSEYLIFRVVFMHK